jgi:hypothetical protein
MFQRFAAGTAVASIVIAIAAIILSVIPGPKFERIYPITILWCCVPLSWGVWAVLTPSRGCRNDCRYGERFWDSSRDRWQLSS